MHIRGSRARDRESCLWRLEVTIRARCARCKAIFSYGIEKCIAEILYAVPTWGELPLFFEEVNVIELAQSELS